MGMRRKLLFALLALMFIVSLPPVIPNVGAPSVVGTSTTSSATNHSYQRKTFYAEGRFWVFYSDGTNMAYQTSSDGSSWNSSIPIRPSVTGSCFSVWFNGVYLHYVYSSKTESSPILYRRGNPNSDGTITWSTAEQTAVSGASSTFYLEVFVSVDSDNYPWIGYESWANLDFYPFVTKSSLNNGSWSTASGFPYQLSTVEGSNAVSVIPLTSNKMYITYPRSSNSACGKLWNGTDFESEETIISQISGANLHSAVAINDDVYVVAINDTNYDIVFNKRTYGSGWGAESLVQETNYGSAPSLSKNSSLLVCSWAGSPTAHHIYYKEYNISSTTWDTDPTDWIDETEDTMYNISLTSFYETYRGVIYVTGASSPYNVKFAGVSPPINEGVTITNMDNTDYLYSMKRYYHFESKHKDINGWTDVAVVMVAFSDGSTWVNASFNSQTNTWGLVSGSNIAEVETGTNSSSGHWVNATFHIRIKWNIQDALDIELYQWCNDTTGKVDSWEEKQTNYANIETDLASSDLTVDDYRVNPSQTLTMSGFWYYEGSSVPPPNGDYQVKVKLSGVQKGSTDTTLVSGYFSISDVTAESTFGSYSYTVEATHMASAGSFSAVVVDRIELWNVSFDDSRVNVGSTVQVRFKVRYDYDDLNFDNSKGSVNIEGSSATYSAGSGLWYRDIVQSGSVGSNLYDVNDLTFTDSTYGLTSKVGTGSSSVITDRIEVYSQAIDDSRVNINDNIEFRVQARLDYDNHALGSGDSVTANFGSLSWDAGNSWFDGSRSQGTVGDYSFTIASGNEVTYGITTVYVGVSDPTGIWDRLLITVAANVTNPALGDTVGFTVSAIYDYDNSSVTFSYVNTLRNETHYGEGASFTDMQVVEIKYLYTGENASDNTYGITTFSSNTVTVMWGGLFIEAYEIIVDDSRANVNSDVYLRYHLRFSYNQSDVGSGTLWINDTSHSISSGWANFTVTYSSFVKTVYVETAVDVNGETDYGQIPGNPEIIWDGLKVQSLSFTPLGDAEYKFTVHYIYAYDSVAISGGSVRFARADGTVNATLTSDGAGYAFVVLAQSNITQVGAWKFYGYSEPNYGITYMSQNQTVNIYALTFYTTKWTDETFGEGNITAKYGVTTVNQPSNGTEYFYPTNWDYEVTVYWHNQLVNVTTSYSFSSNTTQSLKLNVWDITFNAKDDNGTLLTASPSQVYWTFPNGTQNAINSTDGTRTFTLANGTHYYEIKYQDVWVSEEASVAMTQANVTLINKNCWVYSLTVYVTDVYNQEKSGAMLNLFRNATNLNGLYGLPASPTAQTFNSNSTHARYVWPQLANQSSSYKVSASLGGQTATSASTTLTSNSEVLITIGGGTEGGPGGYVPSEEEAPSPVFVPPEVPEEIEEYLPYGAIFLVVLIVAIPVLGIRKERKKTRSQRIHGTRNARKKRREMWKRE